MFGKHKPLSILMLQTNIELKCCNHVLPEKKDNRAMLADNRKNNQMLFTMCTRNKTLRDYNIIVRILKPKIGSTCINKLWLFFPFGIFTNLGFCQIRDFVISRFFPSGIFSNLNFVHAGFCPTRDFVQLRISSLRDVI